jgi:DNA-binding MarR family transcriptional regulator
MAASALALLDRKGIGGLTPHGLAGWLGADPALVGGHFRHRDALLDSVAATMMREVEEAVPSGQGWRAHLRARAIAACRAMAGRRDGALVMSRALATAWHSDSALPSVAALRSDGFDERAARAALLLVDRFALGWAIAEQAAPARLMPTGALADRLEPLLRGLAPEGGKRKAAEQPREQYRVFQNRLWTLLRIVRESASITYAREMQLVELDRRLLLLLDTREALNVAELAALTGADKAQVSRAVKRVELMGLAERTSVRSPLRLSPAGRRLTERVMRLAEQRNAELTVDITDAQLADFSATLDRVMARAMLLYEQERQLAAGQVEGASTPANFGDVLPSGGPGVERTRILPPLFTLCSYVMRSGALAFKRLTGLSNFEVWVLSEIGRDSPVTWARLTEILKRDHSQAGRTVRRLIELDLVRRSGAPGRRHGSFSPTVEGRRLCTLIDDCAVERSEFLLQDIAAPQLAAFLDCFAIIEHNAETRLEREKIDEREPGSSTR